MHVRAVLLSELVSKRQKLVHILVQGYNRILQQFLNAAKINSLIRVPLDHIKADLVQTDHGPDKCLVVSLLKQDLYGLHAAFDSLLFYLHLWHVQQGFKGDLGVADGLLLLRGESVGKAAMERHFVLLLEHGFGLNIYIRYQIAFLIFAAFRHRLLLSVLVRRCTVLFKSSIICWHCTSKSEATLLCVRCHCVYGRVG